MHYTIPCLLLFWANLSAQSLPVFRYQGSEMQVLEEVKPDHDIIHTDAIQPGEDFSIQLFKNYFHPSSLEAYKSFFLAKDWFGMSMEEFNRWQTLIGIKKLHLQNIFHLRQGLQGEFLVIQYVMESPEYSVYQSTEFKKTPEGWKHTSIQHDEAADFLMRIGTFDTNVYDQKAQTPSTVIELDVLQANEQRTFKEKFDRSQVFTKIETLLKEKEVSQDDIELARTYFTLKDDAAFIEYISSQYHFDDVDLMQSVNEAAGFKLYHFSSTQND